MIELESAATDPGMIGRPDRDVGAVVDQRAGFVHGPAGDGDVAGKNQGASALAGLRQTARDEQLVEPGAPHQFRGQCERVRLQRAISPSRPPRSTDASAAWARSTQRAASRLEASTPWSAG